MQLTKHVDDNLPFEGRFARFSYTISPCVDETLHLKVSHSHHFACSRFDDTLLRLKAVAHVRREFRRERKFATLDNMINAATLRAEQMKNEPRLDVVTEESESQTQSIMLMMVLRC